MAQNPDIAVLLLAAGASRRMGGPDKLLEPIAGEPLLCRTARAALASRAGRVIVVLPAPEHARAKVLGGLNVEICAAADHGEGIGGSLRNGLAMLPASCKAVIVALADMPAVTKAHYNALIDAYEAGDGAGIFRATASNGQAGNPVLFDARHFKDLEALHGDRGARDLFAMRRVVAVPTPGMGAVQDLDTPQDWRDIR
ncbi:MAG: nucleotidyltransferase family protein [Paracoccaceae bacterium]